MRKNLLPSSATIFLSVALFISGCQFQLLPPAGSTSMPNEAAEQTANRSGQVKTSAASLDSAQKISKEPAIGARTDAEPPKPAKRATISKEERIVNAIIEIIEVPAEEPHQLSLVVQSLEPTSSPATQIESQPTASQPIASQPAATPAPPFVYITGAPIHIRTGPSEVYDLRGIADTGATLSLVGQADNCQWYQVQHADFGTAWLSSSNGNVTLYNTTCSQLAVTN